MFARVGDHLEAREIVLQVEVREDMSEELPRAVVINQNISDNGDTGRGVPEGRNDEDCEDLPPPLC